jgi:hypothetical protein
MKPSKDPRQPMNPRNNHSYDYFQNDLGKLLELLPVKIKPLTISQQFEVTKMNRLLSAPAVQSQDTF